MAAWVRITNEGTDALNFSFPPFIVTRNPTEVADEAAADRVINEAAEWGVTVERTEAPA